MQMIVTNKVENNIQAATIEIIKTVMAYSLIQPSNSKPSVAGDGSPFCQTVQQKSCQLRRSGDHAV
jgi:hypothetical protein